MSIVRNTVVLRNAALGALVVLDLFECNGFVAVRFGIKGVLCKENRSNTLRTSRVHVHGRLLGPTRPVRGRVHGPFTAVYTAVYTRIRVHRRYKAVYAPYTRLCTRLIHSRIHGPCTWPVHGSVNVRVHGPSCTWQVGLYGAVYTFPDGTLRPSAARYGRVHDPFTARSRQCIRPCTTAVTRGRPTRAYVYTAVKRPCTRRVHVRVHGQYTVVYMAGRPYTRPRTRAETARYGRGPYTRP